MAVKLAQSSRGEFTRKAGKHKFYLGHVAAEAMNRAEAIDTFWERVRDTFGEWTDETLEVAKAIGRGKPEVTLSAPDPKEAAALARVCLGLPVAVKFRNVGEAGQIVETYQKYERVSAKADRLHELKIRMMELQREFERVRNGDLSTVAVASPSPAPIPSPAPVGSAKGQTLFAALDAYREHIRHYYREAGKDTITDYGRGVLTQIETLRRHLTDKPLSSFGLKDIEAWQTYWENRPLTEWDEIVSVDYMGKLIGRQRDFLKWLHKEKAFTWRKPEDYEPRKVRVKQTAEEREAPASSSVSYWDTHEIKTLWEYANPMQRVILCFGLNMGFGPKECTDLTLGEIKPDGWVDFVRRKTRVRGVFKLWPITLQAIQWYQEHRRGGSKAPQLLLASGHRMRPAQIAKAYKDLVASVQEDKPDFRYIAPKYLRKTGAVLVRRMSGSDEVASTYLMHGKPWKDNLLGHYIPKEFEEVATATDRVNELLAHVWDSVKDPFPVEVKKPQLSKGKRDKIEEMRRNGVPYSQVCVTLEVSPDTVRRYATNKRVKTIYLADQKAVIEQLWRDGTHYKEIMRLVGCSKDTAYRNRPKD